MSRTDLVGGVSVSNDPVGSDDEGVNLVVLEERADHGVGEEGGRDLEGEELERSETGAWCRKSNEVSIVSAVDRLLRMEANVPWW